MTADRPPPFGELLRQYRQAAGLTQEVLADRARLSVRGVSDLERGVRHTPRRQTVRLLADALTLGTAERARLEGAVRRLQGPPTAGRSPSAALGSRLPVPLTSFVGRQWELTEVRRLLSTTRLLTLTGVGGIGKTRLAMEAAGLLDSFPDGIWLVELAVLTDAALVPQAIATALGLHETPDRPLLDSIIDRLREAKALLLLDNCEHLVAACADLTETMLRACPQLQMLATSREVLGSAGETVWQVPALSVPEERVEAPHAAPAAALDGVAVEAAVDHVARLLRSEAIQLFTDRGRAVLPSFTLTSDNAAAVTQICRRLDGVPLAIELAAARVRVLTPQQIAARLDDRFRLLTSAPRTAVPRQQTLRAAMDWSYDLLSESEQTVLRRLSVFVGGFTLEAAEAVCTGADNDDHHSIAAADVLDLLTQLSDKSLVIAEEHGEAARYRLLETVRQYAGEKLVESGEVATTRDRHLTWYLALAQAAEGAYRGAREWEWLARLEQEHDNLRAALSWSLQGSESETALRLAGALPPFWEVRGHVREARQWLAHALAMEVEAPAAVRAKALHGAGWLAYLQGDYAAARQLDEESLCLYRYLGDRQGIARAQADLARTTFRQGDLATARALLDASLALYQSLGHKPGIASVQGTVGLIALRQGDHTTARRFIEARLAINRELGNRDGIADALDDLAMVAGEEGDHEQQVALLEESLALFRELGNRGGIALVLGSLGMVASTRGDYDRALALLHESLTLYQELSDRRGIALLRSYQGMIALYQREYARAEALTRESLALYQAMDDTWSIGRYLSVLAGAAFGQGHLGRAARIFAAAVALRERLGTPLPALIQPHHDSAVAALRRRLGDDAFAAVWTAGAALSVEEALAEALADLPPV